MICEGGARPGPRICFVTNDFPGPIRNGGIGTHFQLMSFALAERGWDVHVLFCGPVDDATALAAMPGQLAEHGITFASLDELPAPAWLRVPHYGDGQSSLLDSQRAFEVLEVMHAEHPFDLIEFSDWRALGFRSVQAKRAGLAFESCRLAVKLHSTTAWQRRGNHAPRQSVWELKVEWCERYAFELADVQLSPSHYMLADTCGDGWDVRDDAVVAYPFPDRQASSEDEASDGEDIAEVVFFGRLERRKGLDIFLDALDVVDLDLPVIFLGRDSYIDGRPATKLIAERMAGRPHTVLPDLNRDEALAVLLRGGRLAVMPSQCETFGFTVAECIANEIPFLAANAGGIPEVVAHQPARERWLFPPTADGIATALRRRLGAPADEERELRSVVAGICDATAWNDRVETTYRGLAARPLTVPPRSQSADAATVAVGIAYFNHADYLPAALASLRSQTRQPDEVFVVDDGSTDHDARRVFHEQEGLYPDWTFLRQENAGPGAARNRCLEASSSEFFLPFDSDNVATPALVETLLEAVLRDGRDAATCHMLAFTDADDLEAQRYAFRFAPTGGPRVLTVLENVLGDTCGLFRAEALSAVNGFETVRWSPHEDWETYTKLAFAGYRVDVVPRPLFYYRTGVGGRLDVLASDPERRSRLRRRMIDDLLADAPLERAEQIDLWECLVGFANLEQGFHQKLDEINTWREEQLEGLRAWLTGKLEAETARALLAEERLAAMSVAVSPTSHAEAPAPAAPAAPRYRTAGRALLGSVLGEPLAAKSVSTVRRTLRAIKGR